MPRRPPHIRVEVVPLEINGTQASRAWIRATKILLRAQARRVARLATLSGDSRITELTAERDPSDEQPMDLPDK